MCLLLIYNQSLGYVGFKCYIYISIWRIIYLIADANIFVLKPKSISVVILLLAEAEVDYYLCCISGVLYICFLTIY